PAIYRWRFRSRISRWYRGLLMIEQDLLPQVAADQRKALMERLDDIEEAVNRMKVPASFADQFYNLRGHITFVRARLSP
ncbi:MAG: TAXI family TRAP transporter solute-binding subunit, partial [Thermodesulfobacteriota bacterium]